MRRFVSSLSCVLATLFGCGCATSSTEDGDGASGGGVCNAEPSSDARNCGRCGHDCGGGQCIDGACTAFEIWSTTPPQSVRTLAASEDFLYFVQGSESDNMPISLWRWPKAGGEATVAAQDVMGFLTYRAVVDGPQVCVFTDACCSGSNVLCYDEATGVASRQGGASGADQINDAFLLDGQVFVAADNPYLAPAAMFPRREVYWSRVPGDNIRMVLGIPTSFFAVGMLGGRNAIARVDRMTSFDQADLKPVDLELIVQRPYEDGSGTEFAAAIADEQSVYAWTRQPDGTAMVESFDHRGQNGKVLASVVPWADTGALSRAESVAQDSEVLVWHGTDAIYTMPKGGGDVRKIVEAGGPIDRLAMDQRFLYWTEGARLMALAR